MFENITDCEDGQLRIVGGATDSEGTVEICLGNLWGVISETGWSQTAALVVCKQLGLPLEGMEASNHCINSTFE